MKLETQLFHLCQQNNYNCSITYQIITDYSVEIYKGYGDNYNKIFYTDGHIDINHAIRLGLKFLKTIILM